MTRVKTIAVSGASSSMGQAVIKECRQQGFEVIELKRGTGANSFDLSKPISLDLPALRAFIHVAWDWEPDFEVARSRNVTNLLPLIGQLAQAGCRTILLSTDSIHSRETSNYGLLKYELEREILSHGGSTLRAGFLWGSSISGILKTLQKISNVPLVCLHLHPKPQFSFSNEEEVARELVRLALGSEGRLVRKVSSHETISLEKVLHVLRGKRSTLVHFPISVRLALFSGSILTSLGVQLPFRLDSLRALIPSSSLSDSETEKSVGSDYKQEDFVSWLQSQGGHKDD